MSRSSWHRPFLTIFLLGWAARASSPPVQRTWRQPWRWAWIGPFERSALHLPCLHIKVCLPSLCHAAFIAYNTCSVLWACGMAFAAHRAIVAAYLSSSDPNVTLCSGFAIQCSHQISHLLICIQTIWVSCSSLISSLIRLHRALLYYSSTAGLPGLSLALNNSCVVQGYAWAEDKEHCEEYGRMLQADPSKVSQRAKKRGLPQVCHLHQFCILL